MNKQVWRFEINGSRPTFMMPIGSEILTVQVQNDKPCIWALVTSGNHKEERSFEVYGTGHDIDYDLKVERNYIGTFQIDNGSLVFHLFEMINYNNQ